MAQSVLILRWAGSAYDSLGGLLELTGQHFKEMGLQVRVFTADDPAWPQRLVQVLRQGDITFALTMSGIGTETAVDNRLVWDITKVPLFNWCCDHPSYFPVRHVLRSRYLLQGYVFPDHARYNIVHLKPNGTSYAVHLGIPPRSLFGAAPVPPSAMNGRIMFAKSGRDTNETEARWHGFGPELSHILFAAAEELMHATTRDFVPVLQRITEPRGLFFDGNSQLAMLLINELDGYIRFRRANLVMRSVLSRPVDVFGVGWEHMPWDGARARYLGPLTWRAMIERLPSYSGCLSTNPLIDESVHDRVFFALAAGVPPISDSNTFSRTHMPALEPFAFGFTAERIQHAVDTVLANTETATARTEQTWQALREPFGLRRSAGQILQFVAMHGLNAPIGG